VYAEKLWITIVPNISLLINRFFKLITIARCLHSLILTK